jgi:hypothetical protein
MMGLVGALNLTLREIAGLSVNEFLMALAYQADMNYTEKLTRK